MSTRRMMRGVVAAVSRVNGFVAILTEDESYTILELLGAELEVGDVVRGDLESLGRGELMKNDERRPIDVYVQDIYATKAGAAQQLCRRL